MARTGASPADAAELASIRTVVQRAGLELSEAELASLVEPSRRNEAALRALRADLDPTEEPANTFDARVV